MNFNLSTDVREALESVDRVLEKVTRDAGRPTETWASFCEIGVPAFCLPAQPGGAGFGLGTEVMVHTALILGRHLSTLPYLSTVVLCGSLIADAGSDKQQEMLLPPLVDGATQWALAWEETSGHWKNDAFKTGAVRRNDGWEIDGGKSLVMNGASADYFIVAAGVDAGQVGLFVVPRQADGVTVRDYRTIDGRRAADVEFNHVGLPADALLGTPEEGASHLQAALDLGCIALAGEAVGIMERLQRLTVEYMHTRKQFGQSLGKFQALQHYAANMTVTIEQSKSLALYAAHVTDHGDAAARTHAASGAKAYVGRHGRTFAKSAIQIHGGMGMVNEMPAAHYAKRLTMIDFWLGDATFHMDRLSASAIDKGVMP
jgi:alkylation response protein AidB-like acyl-CoA dehydrogenase